MQPLTSAARRRRIQVLADDGWTSEQIAVELGISRQRVNRIASKAGVLIGKRGGTGRVGAWVPRRLIAAIGSLANDAGVSRSVMVGRAIEVVFSDPAVAKRVLGKGALPVRGYADSAA